MFKLHDIKNELHKIMLIIIHLHKMITQKDIEDRGRYRFIIILLCLVHPLILDGKQLGLTPPEKYAKI